MSLEEAIIKLIISIDEENLDLTINIVDYINNLSLSNDDLNNISQILSLDHQGGSYTNAFHNKCIDYVLEHLNIKFYKNILFLRKQSQMREEQNTEIIEKYINQLLSQDEYPYARDEKQVIQFLIELVVLLKNRDKTVYYFSLIQNKFFNKEE